MEEVVQRERIAFTPEEGLTHYLLLNAPLMPDAGILNGKMKAAIHFFELYRREKNEMFEDFALELIEEIHDLVNETFPVCFGHGICGIGWGTEYLIKRHFLSADEDVCAPCDLFVARHIRQERYEGLGLYDGLTGLLLYYLARIENSRMAPGFRILAENRNHIHQLIGLMLRLASDDEVERLFNETDNADYDIRRLFIYSKWVYPIVLRALGQTYCHDIRRGEVVEVLKRLLQPLDSVSEFPKAAINKQILQQTLVYLKESEVRPLASQIGRLMARVV